VAGKHLRQFDANVVSLPRALSKLGFCSRTEACAFIDAGRVRVNGRVAAYATLRVNMVRDAIEVDGTPIVAAQKFYLMLNKPRGLITTRNDPQQRGTVYDCLSGLDVPFLSAVGRLDKASEGLLLMTNDTRWAERLLNPANNVNKRYHVKIDQVADDAFLRRLVDGIEHDGESLAAKSASLLRAGSRGCWIEIVLDQGRNRQIRRLIAAQGAEVARLVRTDVGGVPLGDLPKGEARFLTVDEVRALSEAGQSGAQR
jgi:23S rRNA pseudouridine2605 synthase